MCLFGHVFLSHRFMEHGGRVKTQPLSDGKRLDSFGAPLSSYWRTSLPSQTLFAALPKSSTRQAWCPVAPCSWVTTISLPLYSWHGRAREVETGNPCYTQVSGLFLGYEYSLRACSLSGALASVGQSCVLRGGDAFLPALPCVCACFADGMSLCWEHLP